MMKGFILNPHEVKLALSGELFQVRRAMKKQPKNDQQVIGIVTASTHKPMIGKWSWGDSDPDIRISTPPYFNCPIGKVGDTVFVKETFRHAYDIDDLVRAIDYLAAHYPARIYYPPLDPDGGCLMGKVGKKRPSTHMTQKISRMNLDVSNIRVERLQDISEEDAKAHGVEHRGHIDSTMHFDEPIGAYTYGYHFRKLWDSTAKQGEKWADNPWVWVYDLQKAGE